MADYCTHRKNPPCIQCDSEDHKFSTRDEQVERLAEEFCSRVNVADSGVEWDDRKAFKAGFDAGETQGYSAGRASARELRNAVSFALDGLSMWRKYQSPGNVTEVEQVLRKALEKWERGE